MSHSQNGETFSVKFRVRSTNVDPEMMLDAARRQGDLMGDFCLKRGQTNARYKRHGYLEFFFPTRQTAREFQNRVEQLCGTAVETKRLRHEA
ncbi:hypothetical protein FNB15_06760 [Ferrovibrio terrae]|uniref:Uncharacterized protein n=1 Tax=Ferrovibrio terrae TaxID=2594003 RepID=A0A516GZN2_9PROT|nr:hypothetical protein [Ferrovibrio terrae]QDO96991.1 hypothetical protein FNB15_06760 [Ferrovibrio terrae]